MLNKHKLCKENIKFNKKRHLWHVLCRIFKVKNIRKNFGEKKFLHL